MVPVFSDLSEKRERAVEAKRRDKLAAGGPSLTRPEIDAAFREVIDTATAAAKKEPEVEGLDNILRDFAKARVEDTIEDLIRGRLSFKGTGEAKEKLETSAAEHLTRQSLKDFTSGVVIAGSGDDEYTGPLIEAMRAELGKIGVKRFARW